MSQNKRPPEPEIVTFWRQGRAPRCCHTCLKYDDKGHCTVYQMQPPSEFAASLNKCPEWRFEIGGLEDADIPF